jgi:hypothetical protein
MQRPRRGLSLPSTSSEARPCPPPRNLSLVCFDSITAAQLLANSRLEGGGPQLHLDALSPAYSRRFLNQVCVRLVLCHGRLSLSCIDDVMDSLVLRSNGGPIPCFQMEETRLCASWPSGPNLPFFLHCDYHPASSYCVSFGTPNKGPRNHKNNSPYHRPRNSHRELTADVNTYLLYSLYDN